jgi:hypothetical protein
LIDPEVKDKIMLYHSVKRREADEKEQIKNRGQREKWVN